jgi:hypothetical protein
VRTFAGASTRSSRGSGSFLAAYPAMPATVIAEWVGRERGLTVLRDRARDLRPAYLPAGPASRTAYDPGEIAQNDFWFPPGQLKPFDHARNLAL